MAKISRAGGPSNNPPAEAVEGEDRVPRGDGEPAAPDLHIGEHGPELIDLTDAADVTAEAPVSPPDPAEGEEGAVAVDDPSTSFQEGVGPAATETVHAEGQDAAANVESDGETVAPQPQGRPPVRAPRADHEAHLAALGVNQSVIDDLSKADLIDVGGRIEAGAAVVVDGRIVGEAETTG